MGGGPEPLRQVSDDEAHVRGDLMLLVVAAHEADRVPVVVAEHDAFAARQFDRNLLGPVVRIDEVALGIERGHRRRVGYRTHLTSRKRLSAVASTRCAAVGGVCTTLPGLSSICSPPEVKRACPSSVNSSAGLGAVCSASCCPVKIAMLIALNVPPGLSSCVPSFGPWGLRDRMS